MPINFEQIEYVIPDWALCAVINDDYSGLEDQDIADLEKFLESVPGEGHWGYCDNESYFSRHNDVHSLGGNVVDVIWNKRI